jgi:hypothetical protein
MDGLHFLAYVEQILAPTLKKGQIVFRTMFPLIRSTGSKKQSKLAAHAPFFYRLTAPISIPSNNSSQASNRSYAK